MADLVAATDGNPTTLAPYCRDHDEPSHPCAGARPVSNPPAPGFGAGRPGGPAPPGAPGTTAPAPAPPAGQDRAYGWPRRCGGTGTDCTCAAAGGWTWGWACGWTWGWARRCADGSSAIAGRTAYRNRCGRRDLHLDEERRPHPPSHEHQVNTQRRCVSASKSSAGNEPRRAGDDLRRAPRSSIQRKKAKLKELLTRP